MTISPLYSLVADTALSNNLTLPNLYDYIIFMQDILYDFIIFIQDILYDYIIF